MLFCCETARSDIQEKTQLIPKTHQRHARAMAWAFAVCLISATGATSALAAPMAYKNGTMFMSNHSNDETELSANYAFTARDALGFALARQTSESTQKRTTQHLTYTRLAKRWNLPDAQANIWLYGNLNQIRGDGLSGSVTAWEPGFQADYETTRVYAATSWHSQRAAGTADQLIRHNQFSVSGGFSFYKAEYDEVQPWLIIKANRESGWLRERSITPMIRLIHKAYFLEIGAKRDQIERRTSAQINLMLTH